jgi:hypothetical protein
LATARRRLIVGFTVPSILIAVLMHATTAQASPTITVSSPPAGQPLYDLRPAITVAYTSDDPAAPLNLATLRVTVNGFDWTAKFTTGPDSATYAVTVDDELIAGALTIAASISDTAGASAFAAANYDVFPTFSALAPSTAEAGDTISLMASGLDPVAGRNKALLTPSGLTAALSDVDRSIGTGRFTLPAGTTSGDVGLEVNGKVARERIRLSVPSVVPNCGGVRSLFATADGGWLVTYGADPFRPVDPQCPPAQIVDFLKWRFVKVTPEGELLPLPVPAGNGLGGNVRIIPDKRRTDAAILRQNLSLPVVVRYKDVDTFLPGSVSAADFDRDGNLFVLFFNSGFRIYRVSREALAQGGDATLEPIVQLPFQSGGPDPYGFVVSCDGFAYAGVNMRLNTYPWVQPRIFKVDLAARAVVGDRLLGVGEELHSLALSCQTNELWSARFLNVQENASAAIARTEVTPNGFGISEDVFVTPAAAFPIGVAVGVGGTVYFQTGTNAILAKRGAINACPVPTGALPVCETPEEGIVILPSTVRWRPQRDTTNSIEVFFKGPKGLKPPTTIEITDPLGVKLTNQSLTFTPPVEPNADPAEYKITWAGPWTTIDPSGNATFLKRGDYKIKIKGIRSDDTPIDSLASDPYSTVSLVEVVKVDLCADDAEDCTLLSDDNPAVSALPGQNPPQGRPGGGKRIFAESLSPTDPIRNRVKVRAIIEPTIPPDPTRSADALTVPVYFKSFDVDDPASCPPGATDPNLCLPDLDKDQGAAVADNRGTPGEGTIVTPVFNVPGGAATARTLFEASSQPGDNYRVIATTSQEWRDTLRAVQPSSTGEMDVTEDGKAGVSELLTVWRTLHVELDSMDLAPTSAAASERNFVDGSITAIGDVKHIQGVGRRPTRVVLMPEATTPPLGLSDRSKDLSGTGDAFGFGRFEGGVLQVGVGVNVERLDGNSSDFVQKLGGMTIPFKLVDASGGNALTGIILEWDSQVREFTLSTAVGRPIYEGGRITVAGVTWIVRIASGPNVAVLDDLILPFHLFDDDDAVTPFTISTGLLQPSDDSATNPYAQAYVRPSSDVASPKQAPFNRNVSSPPGPDETREEKEQLALGRDSLVSMPGYWVMYAQGAFQADEAEDLDPASEIGSPAGQTVFIPGNPSASDGYGSLIYLETIRDSVRKNTSQVDRVAEECVEATLPHEFGHQFGLDDWRPSEPDSLMGPGGCLLAPHYFVGPQLSVIRSKGATR